MWFWEAGGLSLNSSSSTWSCDPVQVASSLGLILRQGAFAECLLPAQDGIHFISTLGGKPPPHLHFIHEKNRFRGVK